MVWLHAMLLEGVFSLIPVYVWIILAVVIIGAVVGSIWLSKVRGKEVEELERMFQRDSEDIDFTEFSILERRAKREEQKRKELKELEPRYRPKFDEEEEEKRGLLGWLKKGKKDEEPEEEVNWEPPSYKEEKDKSDHVLVDPEIKRQKEQETEEWEGEEESGEQEENEQEPAKIPFKPSWLKEKDPAAKSGNPFDSESTLPPRNKRKK